MPTEKRVNSDVFPSLMCFYAKQLFTNQQILKLFESFKFRKKSAICDDCFKVNFLQLVTACLSQMPGCYRSREPLLIEYGVSKFRPKTHFLGQKFSAITLKFSFSLTVQIISIIPFHFTTRPHFLQIHRRKELSCWQFSFKCGFLQWFEILCREIEFPISSSWMPLNM